MIIETDKQLIILDDFSEELTIFDNVLNGRLFKDCVDIWLNSKKKI